MSKHIITKSEMIVVGYVDAAVIGRRLFILPGEILPQRNLRRKSAEVIVVVGNEPCKERRSHESSEGLNIKLFQMRRGVIYSHALSGTGKEEK